MVTTTREAAPAVRLNADWQSKYRQRAQKFLLQPQHSIAELQEGLITKLHLHHQHGSFDGKICDNPVKTHHLNQDSGDAELHGHDVQAKGYLHSDQQLPVVCVIGRSGVGKSSLINHLLQERATTGSQFDSNMGEHIFNYHGLFYIREIPAYDGWHAAEVSSHCERLRRHLHRFSHDRLKVG
ncbi:hypothetical protein GOP47_0002337 [Adiantum capillus-veneris]|uniref:G domain-containing protein n=1 Tax=Adiantum capillus-veneris TaxID=13818 RepID=A0A9D4VAR0_ADICA|nr:hypothetical protein GOP47_0002337 [Adiantum capillus-veneris]